MTFSWIPHVLDILPFFKMDDKGRRSFLSKEFRIDGCLCDEERFELPRGQSIIMSISVIDNKDRLDFGIVFRFRTNDPNNFLLLTVRNDGIVQIKSLVSVYGDDDKYVLKDIMLLLRERFSPMYGSDGWGRDQFKISDKTKEPDAVDEIINQMSAALYDMVVEMSRSVSSRLQNKYDEASDAINKSVSGQEYERVEDSLKELKASNYLNLAVLKSDSSIEDYWNHIARYELICRNYIRIFSLQKSFLDKIDNIMALGEIAHRSVVERRELDFRAFDLKVNLNDIGLAESSRIQTDNMGKLSTSVALMTGITTMLTVFQFFKEGFSSNGNATVYAISSGVVVMFVFYAAYNRRKIGSWCRNHRIFKIA